MMDISVIGISHHTATVETREALALPGDSTRKLLRALRADHVFDETLILDTCNRTEVYFVSNNCNDPISYLLAHIAKIKNEPVVTDTSAFYQHRGRGAVEHLFRVAGALDSQIVGEHQILGQLKDAYTAACEERTSHLFINRMMHSAFRVGKRVQSQTNLGRGSASVAQAAVELSQHVFSSLEGKSVLLVGAGRTGELVAKAVVRCGVDRVVVANRSIERAEGVVEEILQFLPADAEQIDLDEADIRCPALKMMIERRQEEAAEASTRAITLDEIPSVIGDVDLVISATGSPDTVLTHDALGSIIAKSKRSVFIVDIAVPRDVDPELGRLSNVFLYNIDDLDRLVARNLDSRRMEIPRAEAIIADELTGFVAWFDSLEVAPTITLLQECFAQIQAAEVARYGRKFSDTDQEQLERFARSLCNKIFHHHVSFLRDFPAKTSLHDRLAAVDMVRRIFRLEQRESDSD